MVQHISVSRLHQLYFFGRKEEQSDTKPLTNEAGNFEGNGQPALNFLQSNAQNNPNVKSLLCSTTCSSKIQILMNGRADLKG